LGISLSDMLIGIFVYAVRRMYRYLFVVSGMGDGDVSDNRWSDDAQSRMGNSGYREERLCRVVNEFCQVSFGSELYSVNCWMDGWMSGRDIYNDKESVASISFICI